MITKNLILEAYAHLRKTNQSIPDEVLDFIKDTSIAKLEEIEDKSDFKKRYEVGCGFVAGHGECHVFPDEKNVEKYLGIGLTTDQDGLNHLPISLPKELFDTNCPMYKMVLERYEI